MTRDEAKQLLPIIQAWAEGKDVQYRAAKGHQWQDGINGISFSNGAECYRIKPTPLYRPFKDKEECWQEMQKHQPFGWVIQDNDYTNLGYVDEDTVASNSYEQALEYLRFADGKPFGILEEEQ